MTARYSQNQTQAPSGQNPLDTTFGPHSRRGQALKNEVHGGILQIADSAFSHMTLSSISNLARIAEKHPEALRYFPEGSKLKLSADGDRGDYTESGYLTVYCELIYPSENGSLKSSGRESFYSSRGGGSQGIEAAFETFIGSIGDSARDSAGGGR